MSIKEKVIDFCRSEFDAEPEYLWEHDNESAVVRHKENNKWFGVFLSVSKEKLGLESKEKTDILNVKCEPLMIGSLIETGGFYPAYHMNKRTWISIELDGSVELKQIINLLEQSYELTL